MMHASPFPGIRSRSPAALVCAVPMVLFMMALVAPPAAAEWTHRYPRLEGSSHHIYLEGYNLPTFASSPTDPAPSPDGETVAFAAQGWLWLMETATRQARRLTRGPALDSRPAWSPDGRHIAFVRDDTRDTRIMLIDVASGVERLLVDTPAMDIDPAFSPDGTGVFYSSAEAGDLDLWRIDIESGARARLTTAKGQQLNPRPLASGQALAYVRKQDGNDGIASISLPDGSERLLRPEGLAPQLRLATSPDGRGIVMSVPFDDKYQLLVSGADGTPAVRIAADMSYPLMPAWGPDDSIWFVQPGADGRFGLHRVPATGGKVEDMSPLGWDLGAPTARVTIRTRRGANPLATRLAVTDGDGHPLVPAAGVSRFDGQHGRVYFHSPGETTLEIPAGTVSVTASHGFDGIAQARRQVRAGQEAVIDLDLPTLGFDAAARGWYSVDLHSHLNYGGPYLLRPEDLVVAMRAEDLDAATPQIANLHTVYADREWWGWRRTEAPLIEFAQEVRSHFLGHVGVMGADALHDPWFFGPGYPVYDRLDLSNASPLRFARERGGLNAYVHPVDARDPFAPDSIATSIPVSLVPDAVLGDVDTIEVACVWTDELGTSEVWYRFLNLGIPVTPSAGSDTMHNFYRMMPIGSTRVYAKPDGAMSMKGMLDAVRTGRSFVTTGPLLDFNVGGAGPGEVVRAGARSVEWALDVYSIAPAESVEIVVNGQVAWRGKGPSKGGKRRYTGKIDVPEGGWVAARVWGGPTVWPLSDSYPFAHTAAVWLGRVGSTDPVAARAAASDLLRALAAAERQVTEAYPGASGAAVKARFAEARERLARQVDTPPGPGPAQ